METTMKKIIDVEDDFGFSFSDDQTQLNSELQAKHLNDKEQIADLENRLNSLYNAIVPFLDNLCKNPEKSTILWPNRVEKIQAYKKKLEKIVKG